MLQSHPVLQLERFLCLSDDVFIFDLSLVFTPDSLKANFELISFPLVKLIRTFERFSVQD
jgi:hypothetical protein